MVDVSLRPKRRPDDLVKNNKFSPVMGRSDPQNRIGTSGPKGGGEGATAKVKPGSDVFNQYNNDSSYGYYTEEGLYVPADIDMRDGGGMNASGTYYEGGGLLSALGNVFKVTPYGQENTPREQIGYRDIADMFDRGGPQASGGRYQGGGMISVMGNLLDDLGGVDQGTRTPYVYETSTATPTVTANTQRNYVGSGANPGNVYVPTTGYPDMRMPANAAYMPNSASINVPSPPKVTSNVLPDMLGTVDNFYTKDSLSFLEFRREALKLRPLATNEEIERAYENYLLRP